ncbi:MAG: SAM-dependent methyltransferase [Proteobacteria bacterium]|nr:SAM-dependent methyltransferase [Pseudomonadota bacterium]
MTMDIAITAMVLAIIATIFASTMFTGASPVPTSKSVRDTMMAVLADAGGTIEGPIYELGAAWGGLARVLAGRYPASPVRAFEISLLPWAVSAVRHYLDGPQNLCFRLKDFNTVDLSDAALVVCYLPGETMQKLKPKLEAELPKGALVLSNTFAFRGWQPIKTRTASDIYASQVYLYRVG